MVLCSCLHVADIIIKMFSACNPPWCYDLRVEQCCIIMDTKVGFLVKSGVAVRNYLVWNVLKIAVFANIYVDYLRGIVSFHSVYSRRPLGCDMGKCMFSKRYIHPIPITLQYPSRGRDDIHIRHVWQRLFKVKGTLGIKRNTRVLVFYRSLAVTLVLFEPQNKRSKLACLTHSELGQGGVVCKYFWRNSLWGVVL